MAGLQLVTGIVAATKSQPAAPPTSGAGTLFPRAQATAFARCQTVLVWGGRRLTASNLKPRRYQISPIFIRQHQGL
jgi:hypothetical protein